jgi:pSer/pThr/pTyr-binding forkhead associated (FHA) protein
VVGGQLGGDFTITPHGATIGRNPANSICIADQYISGNHARIDYANGYYYITNLSTSNGTMINGNRIESPAILKHNDVITMGTTQFLVIFF